MQENKLNIDISKAQDVTCENCGNYTFEEVVLMKRISAILSPTGKEAIVPIPTFACNACGFINKQFLPVKPNESETEPASGRPSLSLEK
jgi:uncharacterized Zn finger protein